MKIFPTFSRLPALKLLAGIFSGIILAHVVSIPIFILIAICSIIFIGSISIWRTFPQLVVVVLYWIFAIACGYLIGSTARQTAALQYPSLQNPLFPELPATLHGEIVEIQQRDSNSLRCIVEGIVNSTILPPTRCRALLTLYNTQLRHDTLYNGYFVTVHGKTRTPHKPLIFTDFSETQYYASINVQWLFSAQARDLGVLEKRYNIRTYTERCAMVLEQRIFKLFPPDTAPFAIALLTGNRSFLSREIRDEYNKAGTAHILAISGLHVSFVLVFILIPLAVVRNFALRFSLAILVIMGYVLITGASASAIRAAVMIALLLLIQSAERDVNMLNILAFTIVVILMAEPPLLYSMSLWLSVSAVLGISLFYPVFQTFFRRIFYSRINNRSASWLINSLAISFASSSLLCFLIVWHFSIFSLVSPLSNLVIVPLSSGALFYTICALLSLVIPVIGENFAILFSYAADLLFRLMSYANHISAGLSFAAVQGVLAIPIALLYSVGSLYCAFSGTLRLLVFRICVVLCFVGCLWIIARHRPDNDKITILPRRQIVAVCVPLSNNTTALLLQDRKNDAYPHADPGLLKYLQEIHLRQKDSLLIIANGSTSVYLCGFLARHIPFRLAVTSLHYQQPHFFAALDTLERHHILIDNLYNKCINDSSIVIRHGIRWNVWLNTLTFPNSTIVLPQYSAGETTLTIAHQLEKP